MPTGIAVAAVASFALAGGVLAARILLRPIAGGDHVAAAARAGVGDAVPTSFGTIAVEQIRMLRGLRARAVGGVTHFPSFVPADRTQVQVRVSLTNLHGRSVSYSADQFRLRFGRRATAVAHRTSALPDGTLQPGASIETELSFVVPQDGSRVRLAFTDPGRSEPIVVDLGRTLRPRARSPDRHDDSH